MKKTCLLLCLVLVGLMSGCSSKPAGKTSTKFKIGLSAIVDLSAVSAGGAMLWGRSDKGDMFGTVINTGSALDLSLANGGWTFWAVAWQGDASGAKFSGEIRCAKNFAALNGSDVQVSLSLANAACGLPDFTPTSSVLAGKTMFPDISHFECDKLTDHGGLGCGAKFSGAQKSVTKRLVLAGFTRVKNGPVQLSGNNLVSNCISSSGVFIKEHLPLGNGFFPALTFLDSFYSSTDCNEIDPKGFKRATYEYGFMGSARLDTIRFTNEGQCDVASFSPAACRSIGGTFGGSCNMTPAQMADISQATCVANSGAYSVSNIKKFELITTIADFELCAGVRTSPNSSVPHPFASGAGTLASPYTICREYQLNRIGANYPTSHFSLQADLDMNQTSLIFGGVQESPPCSEDGDNFNPIGGLYDASCAEVAAVDFTGSFFGQGHTISNIRLFGDTDKMGFIRSGGTIQDLILSNIEVEGGVKVGTVSGAGATKLSNIQVIGGKVRGREKIGGVAGEYTSTTNTLLSINAKKMFIRQDGSNAVTTIGGLIGDTGSQTAGSLTFERSSFEGMIHSRGTSASTKIGGLIGSTSSVPLNINTSFTSGAMVVQGDGVIGGLVGSAGASVSVGNSYSKMNIGPSEGGLKNGGSIGGLVGYFTPSGNASNSFFNGSIMFPCYRGVTAPTCSVGGISGSSTLSLDGNTKAAFTTEGWFTSPKPGDVITLSAFESPTIQSNLVSASSGNFINVGTTTPRLSWETGICTLPEFNSIFATQGRTGTLLSPYVLCTKEQWKLIKNNQTMNFVVGDNLSVGDILAGDKITDFSGTLSGTGLILGGFYYQLSTNPGVIVSNSGSISNVVFANSYLDITGGSTYAGFIGVNTSSGSIKDSSFYSVNLLSGMSINAQGVIAGYNQGSIERINVDSAVSSTKTAGLAVGKNDVGGLLNGIKIDGSLNANSSANQEFFGLAAAYNLGTMSEIDISGTLYNTASGGGNTNSGSYFGLFVAKNSGQVRDILIGPYAKLNIDKTAPKYSQVIGQSLSGSNVKRVVVVTETSIPSPMHASDIKPFTTTNTAGVYESSFVLTGSVFKYSDTPIQSSSCSLGGTPLSYTYVLTAPISVSGLGIFSNGFFVQNAFNNKISSRISGTVTDGVTSFVMTPVNGNFAISCGAGGVAAAGNTNLYPIQSVTDFAETGVTSISPIAMGNIETFCSSSSGISAGNKPSAVCDLLSGELDIVSDMGPGEMGYDRLVDAHTIKELTGQFPFNRPIWVMSDEGYPKLLLTH